MVMHKVMFRWVGICWCICDEIIRGVAFCIIVCGYIQSIRDDIGCECVSDSSSSATCPLGGNGLPPYDVMAVTNANLVS